MTSISLGDLWKRNCAQYWTFTTPMGRSSSPRALRIDFGSTARVFAHRDANSTVQRVTEG